MILALCLLGLFGVVVHGADEAFDYQDLDFVFHDRANLLLAMDDNNCYFIDAKSFSAEADIRYHQHDVEVQVYYSVHHHQNVTASSMSAMRDKYQDLLADYRCRDKAIFTLDIDWSLVGRENSDGNSGWGNFNMTRIRDYLANLSHQWDFFGR